MENISEAGDDDQGSGWFEVKKKHRATSKLQNSAGGISSRNPSNFLCSQPLVNEKSEFSNAKQRSQHSKSGTDMAKHVQVDGEKSNSMSKEGEKAMDCLDKYIVNQDSLVTKLPSRRSISSTDSNGETGNVHEVTQKEKLDIVPKIKWGDLEENVLQLHRENTNRAEIKFGDIGDDHLVMHRKSENVEESVSCTPSCTASQDDKALVASVDLEHVPDRMFSSALMDESFDENRQQFDKISSQDKGLPNGDEKLVDPNDDVGCRREVHEQVEPISNDMIDLASNNPDSETSLSLAIEGVAMMTTPLELDDIPENGAPDISEVPPTNGVSEMIRGAQDLVLLPPQPRSPEASCDTPVTSVVDDCKSLQDRTVHVELSKAQLMSSLGEGESGESKERFRQRLWCFLFENLNRAMDELYLLCELECDLEQMKEAVLVLEEASSDFKELKSRVEVFETMKRSSSQLLTGEISVNMKTDHRRPHALSWEVRRMTTSPHRAEILSSSLEAFKKIQHERASTHSVHDAKNPGPGCPTPHISNELVRKSAGRNNVTSNVRESVRKSRKHTGISDLSQGSIIGEKRNGEPGRSSKTYLVQNGRLSPQSSSIPNDPHASQLSLMDSLAASVVEKCKTEPYGSASETEKQMAKKDKMFTESKVEKNPRSIDPLRRQSILSDKEKEKEKKNTTSWKSMDAWKEKRNWEDILASPLRSSSRVSYSPSMGRKSVDRTHVLHDKLMSPEKKKKTAFDLKKEAEERHARAMRIRSQLETERVQRLQRTSEKLNRVNELQAVRNMKLREGMYARHQRSESRHEAYLAQVVKRAGDESSKVNEVRFITSLNEENKKLMLRQKLHDSELRRAEKLQVIKIKQKEDMAREEAVLERRKLLEAEKLQRLAETQRKKEEAQVRREEERKASSAAREAKAIEQLRKKEVRAKAQQEEAELLAQKLAERLSESEQRRKFYLEQIRERASMDFRDQTSPLLRRFLNKEGLGRSTSTNSVEDFQVNSISGAAGSGLETGNATLQHSLKRRIKRIRQRLMALKYEFPEPPVGAESVGIGYRTQVGSARAKIGRWLQELQRLRQARKEGAASIGLIVGDMIKFLEGKDCELHASRQAGLLDFIASALPASHTSRPEACQVTIYLLRLLRVVLSVPANRSYFLAQNLLPPIIPMLSAALENYIKIAASFVPGSTNLLPSKMSAENFESISEILEGFLWIIPTIIGHVCSDERQLQMQEGLLELVIAYQVIHRLRDLFALYDRPQVEGSPFPSSILSSLNLLAVLTSRPGTISSINWRSFPSADKSQEAKVTESADLGGSSIKIFGVDYKSPLSVLNVTADVPLSDVPEDRPLDESCKTSRHEESLFSLGDLEKELTDISDGTNVHSVFQMCAADVSDESQRSMVQGHDKSLSQNEAKNSTDISAEHKNENFRGLKQPIAFLLSVIAETGLVSLPSLLTAVLLQANNRLSSEQASYVLPSNFEEVATGVLKVLNNLALLDITLMQRMLARPDLKMEFFHLMSFLLSHCTSKWKVATDQVGLLLLESLLLLGYFALFHPGNQAVLRWGKSPTILHKVCDLPFVFFSDPELMPILAGALVAACYGSEQNRGVVQQELSTDMMLSLIRSCRNGLPATQSDSSPHDNPTADGPCEGNQLGPEPRKPQGDLPLRSSRNNPRSTRVSLGKSGALGSNTRVGKMRSIRDVKATKTCQEWALKHNLPASETSSNFMLHSRFPNSFIDRAEDFFSEGI